jgi:hypothetical protein
LAYCSTVHRHVVAGAPAGIGPSYSAMPERSCTFSGRSEERLGLRRQRAVRSRSRTVAERARGRHEPRLHEPAHGVVDEHRERADRRVILRPAVIGGVDLHQLAQALVTQARLVKRPALTARQPQPVLNHPGPQRLARYRKPMLLRQLLGRQRRPEVGVALADQGRSQVPHAVADAVVRRPATRLVPQRRRAILAKCPQQPLLRARAQAQDFRRMRRELCGPRRRDGASAYEPNSAAWSRTRRVGTYPSRRAGPRPSLILPSRVPGPFQTCRRPGDPVISGGRTQTMNVWQMEETTHVFREMQRRFPLIFGQVGGRPVPSRIGIAE